MVLREGLIAAVCPTQDARNAGLVVEQWAGCLMPGLIDAHVACMRCAQRQSVEVHMEFDEAYPLHEQPLLSDSELLEAMAGRALRMASCGITTARDLGGRNFAALRALPRALIGSLRDF